MQCNCEVQQHVRNSWTSFWYYTAFHRLPIQVVPRWRFLQFIPFNVVISYVTGQKLTKFVRGVTESLAFNRPKSELPFCSPIANANVPNEGGAGRFFSEFALKLVVMTLTCKRSEKGHIVYLHYIILYLW